MLIDQGTLEIIHFYSETNVLQIHRSIHSIISQRDFILTLYKIKLNYKIDQFLSLCSVSDNSCQLSYDSAHMKCESKKWE